MYSKSSIPTVEAEFHDYANVAVLYLNVNAVRLIFTDVAKSKLVDLNKAIFDPTDGYNFRYTQSLSPTTTGPTNTTNKKTSHTTILGLFNFIFGDIPNSALTQEDRDTLIIPLPTYTHTPATIPVSIPSITVSHRGHLTITLSILEVASSLKLSNVTDARFIEIETATEVNGTTQAAGFPHDDDFNHIATLSRSTYIVTFTSDELKNTEFIRARYLNSKSEPGTWGEVISVVVS